MIVARSAANAMRGQGDPLVRRMLEANTPGLLLSCPPSEGSVFGVKPRVLPPGRALYVTRRRTTQIQTALVEHVDPEVPDTP
ncbi:Type VII secretion protein EccC OS=Streptomyces fumanus OX=67302 GN=GCM10018772_56860 PE=4 SV=1 [Streptomyces fumanus]